MLDGAQAPVTVKLDGGELDVDVDDELNFTLTGWAEPVFRGELSDELVAALEQTLMPASKRLEQIQPYPFAQLERKIEREACRGNRRDLAWDR